MTFAFENLATQIGCRAEHVAGEIMNAKNCGLRAGIDSLDEEGVVAACAEGLITARQAADALARLQRASERHVCVVKRGAQYIGEVSFDGVAWLARRYGSDYSNAWTFTSEAEAHAFVLDQRPTL